MKLEKNGTLLFLGDSITSAQRDKHDYYGLGEGFVKLIGDELADWPITILNRGMEGDQVRDIVARMENDNFDIEPDSVTVLAGVNDAWLQHAVDDKMFRSHYQQLLANLNDKDVSQVILMQPFVLFDRAENPQLYDDVARKAGVVEQFASENNFPLVSLFDVMKQEGATNGFELLTKDGIHPSRRGHQIIAQAWLEALGYEDTYEKNTTTH